MLEAIDPTVVASFSEYMTYAAYALAFFPETVRWRDEAALWALGRVDAVMPCSWSTRACLARAGACVSRSASNS